MGTRFQVMSDLHLEFGNMYVEPAADYLILAGDVGVGTQHKEWVRDVCEEFKTVIYVTGNHEYYHNSIEEVDQAWRLVAPNFHTLQKHVVEVEGVRIAGCTLWTSCGENDTDKKRLVERGMNDCRIISRGGHRFSADDMVEIHYDHRWWLKEQTDIDLVVTHHAPSYRSVNEFWRVHGQDLNEAFYSDCENVIEKLAPKYWIHGHMHDTRDYMIEGTRVICNPRGYRGYGTNPDFDKQLVIEI